MLKRIQVISSHFLTAFSTAAAVPNRAIVYTQNGDPAEVLRVIDYPPLPPPPPQTANIRFLLSPVNPADINVVEGAYPIKATSAQGLVAPDKTQEKNIFIGGNEGLAKVVKTGDGVVELQEGDWVVMTKPQSGTWCSERNVQMNDVLKLPLTQGLTDVQAATMTVRRLQMLLLQMVDLLFLRLILRQRTIYFMSLLIWKREIG
jgi:trans-2-enoyl-CoA reductase